MTEWGVVTVLIALVGLLITVMKPLLSVNTSLVKVTERMEHMTERIERVTEALDDLSDQNTQNHKRIWDRVDEHGKKLNDHENRINRLERAEK